MKKLIGKKVLITLVTIVLLFIPQIVLGASGVQQYPELQRLVNFINFIISLFRWGAGSVAGLYATVTGWQMLRNNDALDVAKKNFTNAVYALIFIFGGSSIASFFVNKMASIFLS